MQRSKTIGIALIVLLGASFAVNAKAQETVTTTTTKTVVTSVKKQPLKSVKPAIKKVQLKTQAPLKAKKVVKAAPKVKEKKEVKVATIKPKPVSAPVPLLPPPPVNPNAANTLMMTPKTEPSKLTGALAAEFYPENDVQKDSSALYYVLADYKLSPKHKFSFIGRVSQSFIPAAGQEAKVAALDPKFDYFYTFTEPDQKNFELKIRYRNIPGWSEDSQINGIKAFNSLRLEFMKPIGDFVFGLRPYVGHYWTEYAVNAKNEPLPLFTVGHNLVLGYKITSKFSWCMEVDTGFKMLQPEEVKAAAALAEQNGSAAPKTMETVRTSLFVGTELAYQFTKSFATRLGYMQDDGLIADGRYTMNVFGRETSRYYIGLDYVF